MEAEKAANFAHDLSKWLAKQNVKKKDENSLKHEWTRMWPSILFKLSGTIFADLQRIEDGENVGQYYVRKHRVGHAHHPGPAQDKEEAEESSSLP